MQGHNPYDNVHDLSIEIYDKNMSITYNGAKLVFRTSVPSEYELKTLPPVVLSSDLPRNPGEVRLGQV